MNALISVHDKEGIHDFSTELQKYGINLYATDSTAAYLEKNGIAVKHLSDITGFSDLLGGRVKTLHPSVFASILAVRKDPKHMKQLASLNMPPIDMVVSNLYPFEAAALKSQGDLESLLEEIDIGGVSLIRAAAKNFQSVAVVVERKQYGQVIQEMEKNKGLLTENFLKELCLAAFQKTAYYDSVIADSLGGKFGIAGFPEKLVLNGVIKTELKYGENPYQSAAAYTKWNSGTGSILSAEIDCGKSLSYNNILDANIAAEIISDFSCPCAVVVKHANPCGVATADTVLEALSTAYEADTQSAYGSVIAVNRKMSAECAAYLTGKFVEVIAAPGYDAEAIELLRKKKKLRVLTCGERHASNGRDVDIKRIVGGYIIQSVEKPEIKSEDLKIVTRRAPSDEEIKSMLFATKIVRYLWSNAIVLARGTRTVGIGAGQSSRVDAVRIAVSKSRGDSPGSVMASDAFFPFRDGIDEAVKGGITAVIQPGGSIRDEEVIKVADENDIAMVFTGIRLFRH
jgi:phosphoribosylaminoimidazolecarboxamide formyltransferase/IMP cyclohydrolase